MNWGWEDVQGCEGVHGRSNASQRGCMGIFGEGGLVCMHVGLRMHTKLQGGA